MTSRRDQCPRSATENVPPRGASSDVDHTLDSMARKSRNKGGDGSSTSAAASPPLVRSPLVLTAVTVAAISLLVAYGRGGDRPAASAAAPSTKAQSESPLVEELQPGALRSTPCSAKSYRPPVRGCTPKPAACGQLVLDDFLSANEVEQLREIAERGMSMGGGSGGPTILDLQSGALSLQDKFIDVWMAFNYSKRKAYTRSELAVYRATTERLAAEVERTFGVSGVQLTSPTFFSRISADKPPLIPNDEYWHSHVDKDQYGSFVYTALVYLSERGVDFDGGSLRAPSRLHDPRPPPRGQLAPSGQRLVRCRPYHTRGSLGVPFRLRLSKDETRDLARLPTAGSRRALHLGPRAPPPRGEGHWRHAAGADRRLHVRPEHRDRRLPRAGAGG